MKAGTCSILWQFPIFTSHLTSGSALISQPGKFSQSHNTMAPLKPARANEHITFDRKAYLQHEHRQKRRVATEYTNATATAEPQCPKE